MYIVINKGERINALTDSSSEETSSKLSTTVGIHGGSRTGRELLPRVGDGTVKSMLGGGTCHVTIFKPKSIYVTITNIALRYHTDSHYWPKP